MSSLEVLHRYRQRRNKATTPFHGRYKDLAILEGASCSRKETARTFHPELGPPAILVDHNKEDHQEDTSKSRQPNRYGNLEGKTWSQGSGTGESRLDVEVPPCLSEGSYHLLQPHGHQLWRKIQQKESPDTDCKHHGLLGMPLSAVLVWHQFSQASHPMYLQGRRTSAPVPGLSPHHTS